MTKPRKTPRLALTRIAHKRSTYTQRSGMASRATHTLLAAIGDRSWSHDDIRTALLRQTAVEIEDLLEELPRAAIMHAVSKGWLHRSAGQAWFRVTKRAAAELQLPARNGAGQKVAFLDAAKLPASLPAFEEPKKAEVTEARAAALLDDIRQGHEVLTQARLYQAVIEETGWAPAEIARRLHPDDRKAMGKVWDDVIYHVNVLTLEDEYQTAVACKQLSLVQAYEIFRVPAAHRATLFAAFIAGASRAAVRKLAKQLAE
jgi:hypothetical protein